MDPFWNFSLDGVVAKKGISFCYSVRTPRTRMRNFTLDRFVHLLHIQDGPVYEVLCGPGPFRPYFDVDMKIDHEPKKEEIDDLLHRVLSYLREVFGKDTRFAVTQSHRKGKISFHIVCPDLLGMKEQFRIITMNSKKLGIHLDSLVYSDGRQLMRTIFAIGEKEDSVYLTPVEGYKGTITDHIIQAMSIGSTKLSSDFVTLVKANLPSYVTSGSNEIEDLIYAIDMKQLNRYEEKRVVSTLREHNLKRLLYFKLGADPDDMNESFTDFLENLWKTTVSSISFTIPELYKILSCQNHIESEAISSKYGAPPPPGKPKVLSDEAINLRMTLERLEDISSYLVIEIRQIRQVLDTLEKR